MPGDVMEQQIEDLRERMRLLQQDRRANVDLLGEAEQQVNKENEKQKRYIAPAPWEDAPDEQEES